MPGGLHAAFQVAWALGMTAPLAANICALASRPTAGGALAVITVSAAWALVAALVWAARVAAITSSGRFGRRTRIRIRARANKRMGRA